MKPLRLAGFMALAMTLAACQLVPPASRPVAVKALVSYDLRGAAHFEDRQVQIAPGALTSLATVTLLNASNQTVATARTDAAGAFSLSPGASFTAAAGDLFYLDVYKGTSNNQSGGDVARLRTILQWTSNGWNSTSGVVVVVNPLTTAVCAIQGLNSGTISASVTLGTVAGATVTTGNATINSNWSAVNTLVRDLLAKDQDPLARISLLSGSYRVLPNKAQPLILENFRTGGFIDTRVDGSGSVILAGPKPTPNDPASEREYFSPANVAPSNAALIVSDGTYLYATNYGGYGGPSTNQKRVKKIGSGFNGTIRGAFYGLYDAQVPNSYATAYYKGSMYFPMSNNATQLYQFSVTTGATATIDLPTPMNNRDTGLTTAGDGLRHITSDGTYIYNMSYAVGGGTFNGFTIQVFDPSQGFRQVRYFTLDTTSYYSDAVLCDGTYIYPVNWAGLSGAAYSEVIYNAKMRRYRLSDGVREAEWTFAQSGYGSGYKAIENNPISGSWDPFNKVFWMGNVNNEKIHFMRGGSYIPSGTWQSATLDSGSDTPLFGRLSWSSDVQGADGLSFQVRSASTLGDLAAATWYGPTSTTDSYTMSGAALNPVHAKQRYLQVRATLSSANLLTTPMLNRLSLEVVP